jgi:acrylyl-CoA reductase (NADPH)
MTGRLRVQKILNAIVAEQAKDGQSRATLKQLTLDDLPNEHVLVRITYSSLNYKDALAVSGKGKICRRFPMVCGIDLAGTVIESRDDRWRAGDEILVNGFELSEKYWGGYAQQQRLKGDWLIRKPDALSAEQCMAIGTAGYTSMLCIHAIQDHGVTPQQGKVLVTGAAGGVGCMAVMILAELSYRVVASTGRTEAHKFLQSLGASDVIDRRELQRDCRPLESETWAAVVDAVGSKTLATAIAQTQYEGLVAACGLAAGTDLPSTVMPFILRGVTLRGINSVLTSMQRRSRAWTDLAELIDKNKLREIYVVQPMSKVPELAETLLSGSVRGRIVIDVNK